jgi:hypothetical protein
VNNYRKLIFSFVMLSLCLGFSNSFYAQKDSAEFASKKMKKFKEPKHFFANTVFFDFYNKPNSDLLVPGPKHRLDTSRIGKQLGQYGLAQSSISFYAPLLTINKFNKDSSVNSNFHLLLSGTAYYLQPTFTGISKHTLAKYGLGVRAIYNTGKKSIFFIESTPFLTQDITPGSSDRGTMRMTGTLLWSYSPTSHFNFRLGATKSFLLGNRWYLPFVGIRIGRIDGVNLSAQFPRNISFNIPIGNVVRLSAYTKPQGGVFSFSNRDTVYNSNYYKNPNISDEKVIHFGRLELLTGFRMDVVPCRWFNFYVATGFTTHNSIYFYSNNFNRNRKTEYGDFYSANPKNSIYLNFGITLRIGKTKSYYNNRNMYDAVDINNTVGVGDNNVNPGNGNIVIPKKKLPKSLKPSEIQDLIDVNDF